MGILLKNGELIKRTTSTFEFLWQPLAYGSFTNWLKLVRDYGGIDRQYFFKAAYVTLSSFLNTPIRYIERATLTRKIAETQIEFSPIFIIGHWRSGTTYLHNLMALDDAFGYITGLHTYTPEMFLSFTSKKSIAPLIDRFFFPVKRPMDEIIYNSVSIAEEEEYAMGNLTPLSFYHGWAFPKYLPQLYERSVLFQGVSNELIVFWEQTYLKLIKQITLACQEKQLIIKNPANTSRIKTLLKLFPNAKFIHIYRNPYTVYLSTKKFYKKLLPIYSLQDVSEEFIDECIFAFYTQLMDAYLQSVSDIPPNHLIEIRYEDFVGNELRFFQEIYHQFNLPNFEKFQAKISKHLGSCSSYKKNKHTLDEQTKQKIEQHWQFWLDKWQYEEKKPEEEIST